jgi:hypothetical protein
VLAHQLDLAACCLASGLLLGFAVLHVLQSMFLRCHVLPILYVLYCALYCHCGCTVQVSAPSMVYDLDLASQVWPGAAAGAAAAATIAASSSANGSSGAGSMRRKGSTPQSALLYCLSSPAGCYTDWHIDFGGSAVWYHVIEVSGVWCVVTWVGSADVGHMAGTRSGCTVSKFCQALSAAPTLIFQGSKVFQQAPTVPRQPDSVWTPDATMLPLHLLRYHGTDVLHISSHTLPSPIPLSSPPLAGQQGVPGGAPFAHQPDCPWTLPMPLCRCYTRWCTSHVTRHTHPECDVRPPVLLLTADCLAFSDCTSRVNTPQLQYLCAHPPQGSKVFLVAPPLPTNLTAFESWARSKRQGRTWLARMMQGITQVTLQPGDTLILPPGEVKRWPHTVSPVMASFGWQGAVVAMWVWPLAAHVAADCVVSVWCAVVLVCLPP